MFVFFVGSSRECSKDCQKADREESGSTRASGEFTEFMLPNSSVSCTAIKYLSVFLSLVCVTGPNGMGHSRR